MPNAACPSVPTVVTSHHCACLSPQLQLHGPVPVTADCALPSLSSHEGPSESYKALCEDGHHCTDQHFQDFCSPQKWSGSGDSTDASLAGSRSRGCSQAPVAGVSLKPPKGMPAWQSSICPALAPQSDLVAFQPFCFLLSIVVLTSVLYFRPQ